MALSPALADALLDVLMKKASIKSRIFFATMAVAGVCRLPME